MSAVRYPGGSAGSSSGGLSAEGARDALATALVAGANVTIIPDDGADTITIAAATTGASGIPASTVDAKGDLIAGTAADTVARLGVGTDGQVLTASSGATTGLVWATPSGGTPDDGSVTNVKVASGAAITLDKTVDSTASTGRLALTNAERTKLAGIATGANVYTDEQARDAVATALVAGSNVTITADDGNDTITISATGGGGGTGGIPATTVDAKGDLIAATAADTVARLPVGTNGLALVASSGTTTGLAWAAPAPAGHTHGATDITSGTMATARLGSGTASSATFLRGDSTFATPAISNVTGLQTALDGKAGAGSTGAALWIGTQTAYDAIATKSLTTLYAITP